MRAGGSAGAVFKNEGDVWMLSFDGRVVRLRDAKGLRYIAALLAVPGREVHVLDLVQPDASTARAMKASSSDATLDHEARTRYKQRLAELEADIEEADQIGDPRKAERSRAEQDAILAELSSAYGLGDRVRRSAADPTERARKAVTERVRTTLVRVERAHPSLARHLRRSIRTGAFCSYAPDEPVEWDLVARMEDSPSASDAAPIRVMIVDDHPLWRQTLRNVLEHTGIATVVGEATGGVECVAKVIDLEPDVVLMDIELPDMRGTEATAALVEHGTSARVVVLSSRDERETVLEAVRCGADGYLLKTAEADEIAGAVSRAHAGEAVFPPRLAKIVLAEIRSRPASTAT